MLYCLSFEDLNPKTNKTASIILDFPFPFGPITQLKCLSKGPKVCLPLYDLKFSISSLCMIIKILYAFTSQNKHYYTLIYISHESVIIMMRYQHLFYYFDIELLNADKRGLSFFSMLSNFPFSYFIMTEHNLNPIIFSTKYDIMPTMIFFLTHLPFIPFC